MNATETTATVEERVKSVISDCLAVPEKDITPTANLRQNLGANDSDMLQLNWELEVEFDLKTPPQEDFGTVHDVINYINELEPD